MHVHAHTFVCCKLGGGGMKTWFFPSFSWGSSGLQHLGQGETSEPTSLPDSKLESQAEAQDTHPL